MNNEASKSERGGWRGGWGGSGNPSIHPSIHPAIRCLDDLTISINWKRERERKNNEKQENDLHLFDCADMSTLFDYESLSIVQSSIHYNYPLIFHFRLLFYIRLIVELQLNFIENLTSLNCNRFFSNLIEINLIMINNSMSK